MTNSTRTRALIRAFLIRYARVVPCVALDLVMEDLVNDVARSLGVFPLKPEQLKAVMAFLEGRDVFVSLPTGYGKSLIYAILPAVFDKLRSVLVICLVM